MGSKSRRKKHTGKRSKRTISPEQSPLVSSSSSKMSDSTANNDTTVQITTAYARYKARTQAFRDHLARLLPNSITLTCVSDLGTAAEYLFTQERQQHLSSSSSSSSMITKKVTNELLNSLDESIELREMVATSFGDIDEGHLYMLEMLKYCKVLLTECRDMALKRRRKQRKTIGMSPQDIDAKQNKVKEEITSGHFDVLISEDPAEDEMEDAIPDQIHVPPPSKPDRSYSIQQDLIEGSTFFQAAVFLYSADLLFHDVKCAFSQLSDTVKSGKGGKSDHSEDSQVHDTMAMSLMKVAATVNMALEDIRHLERSLRVLCPALPSFYHVLAAYCFSKHPDIQAVEAQIEPKRLAKNPAMFLDFIAQCIELGFKRPIGCTTKEETVARFSKESGLDYNVVWSILDSLYLAAVADSAPKSSNPVEPVGGEWLQRFENLGGRNNILQTHWQLQFFTDSCITKGYSFSKHHRLGPDWDESNTTESTSDPCMDELAFNRILPELFWCCIKVVGCCDENEVGRIFPLFLELKEYFDGGDIPVNFALSFGFHAMITGIIMLQGESNLTRIAWNAKLAHDNFIQQIRCQLFTTLPLYKRFTGIITRFSLLTEPSSPDVPVLQAYWNPLIAGNFLLHTSYCLSVQRSCDDSLGLYEAHICVHLYNAFRKCGLIDRIDYLESISQALQSSKLVWPSSEPSKGSFTKTFLFAAGNVNVAKMTDAVNNLYTIEASAKLTIDQRMCLVASADVGANRRLFARRPYQRRHESPSNLCKSYGYLLERNSADTCFGQVPAMVEAMTNDSVVLRMSLHCAATTMDDFVTKLVESMNWSSCIEAFLKKWYPIDLLDDPNTRERLRRVAVNTILADQVFGELDFADGGADTSRKVAEAMTEYFSKKGTKDLFWDCT